MTTDDVRGGPPHPEWALVGLLPRKFVVVVCWAAGLLVLGVAGWLAARAVAMLTVVLVPCAVALLLTALLHPLCEALRRLGLPRSLSALGSVLALLVVIGGVAALTGFRVAGQLDELVQQFQASLLRLQEQLARLARPFSSDPVTEAVSRLQSYLGSAGERVTTVALTATELTVHLVIGVLLTLFVVIYLLWDGEQVWAWVSGLFPKTGGERLQEAGVAAWTTLVGYVHGTFIIATIHALVIGTVLDLLGVPLSLPLALLVFLGSFVPIVGVVVAGGLAVLMTLGTQGVVPAVIVLGVLLVENELEAHVLQPLVVGRYVRLHPLAIVVVLTAGSYLGGIAGAVLSVPLVGALRAGWGPLNGRPSVAAAHGPSRLARLTRRVRRQLSRWKRPDERA